MGFIQLEKLFVNKFEGSETRFAMGSSLALLQKEGTEPKPQVPLFKGNLGGSKQSFTNTFLTLSLQLLTEHSPNSPSSLYFLLGVAAGFT